MQNNVISVNERVKVLAIFSERQDELHCCVPLRMKYKGYDYTFTEIGLCHPTMKGKRTQHIFDVTDGLADYRLEFDTHRLTWTLASIADRRL